MSQNVEILLHKPLFFGNETQVSISNHFYSIIDIYRTDINPYLKID